MFIFVAALLYLSVFPFDVRGLGLGAWYGSDCISSWVLLFTLDAQNEQTLHIFYMFEDLFSPDVAHFNPFNAE